MLGNGLGKSRAGRNGEARRAAEWRIVLLSTGEVGIATKIEEAGRGRKAKAGSLVRLIDIPADPGKGHGLFDDCHGGPPAELAQRLKAAALSDYGLAGPAFVTQIAHLIARNPQAKTALREHIDAVQKELLQDMGGEDGQVIRVARHFAVVAVAGDSARVALGLPWNDGEPISAARICLKAWMSQRGGSGSQELLTAITALRDAVETHGQSRFQRLHGVDDVDDNAVEIGGNYPIRDLLGYRFDLQGEAVWAFTPAGLKEVLQGIGDLQTLVGGLVDLGIIRQGPPPSSNREENRWEEMAVLCGHRFLAV